MSTRSLTGQACADGFTNAVFVHSDGYPTYHGPALFTLAEQFGDLHDLLAALTAPTVQRWSCLTPGAPTNPYADSMGDRVGYLSNVGVFHHPTDLDPPEREEWHGGPVNTDTEWAYAIEPDARTLMVAKVVRADRDAPGYQPFDSTIQPVAVVRFGDAVDWAAIESGGVSA